MIRHQPPDNVRAAPLSSEVEQVQLALIVGYFVAPPVSPLLLDEAVDEIWVGGDEVGGVEVVEAQVEGAAGGGSERAGRYKAIMITSSVGRLGRETFSEGGMSSVSLWESWDWGGGCVRRR
ncbi:uncharacterized protein LAJ45_11332 [Morchella importuna]|uniref:uncharacterized protein n=1 Tax=Morchella importuna TaxID=1174673 RepID=UPI001E8D8536|nr:uncharacterized protein LAJ45_11332 [Morchella importuna]KAH8144671.1 hypothetical protein LAJ45_11332 [Morchella importuna]